MYERGLFACRNCGEDAVTHTRSDETIYDVLVLWWRRNVVAPDPDPRYSYLDRLDGLQRGRNAEHGRTDRDVYF